MHNGTLGLVLDLNHHGLCPSPGSTPIEPFSTSDSYHTHSQMHIRGETVHALTYNAIIQYTRACGMRRSEPPISVGQCMAHRGAARSAFRIHHAVSYCRLAFTVASEWLCCFTCLTLTRDRVPKFLPADGIHQAPFFASCHDDAQLIAVCGDVVIALVAQTDHGASDQVSNPETLFDLDLVFFGGANVFSTNLALEGFATNNVIDHEDLSARESRSESCDSTQDDRVDFW